MNLVRYIENETQLEVAVSSAYGWPPLGVIMVITYPDGHRFAARLEDFNKHFTVISPQEIFVTGNNTFAGRPTEKQIELQESKDEPLQ